MNSPEKEKREQETYESFFAGSDQQKSPLRPQPKNEWSEEDGEMLDSIIRVVCGVGIQPNGLREKQVSWLKSLRPSWKPSEEQMKQLHYALTPGSAFDCDILNELYTQLNELM